MERRLRLAVAAALVELAGQAILLTARGGFSGAPLRLVFLLAKAPFCWLTLRRNAGAYLVVVLYEFAGVVAAVATGSVLLGAVAATVLVMLGRAAGAFPTVEWRR